MELPRLIHLEPGKDKCPACGNLLEVETGKRVSAGEYEPSCKICGRSVWWLEWYAARKRDLKKEDGK